MNPMTRMWLIDDNSHLWYQLSKFWKFAKWKLLWFLGFVLDECTFSI
jgi:hypothetical protein